MRKGILIGILSLLIPFTASASILGVQQGGTASSTLTGILIGNGIGPINSLTIGSGLSLTGTTLSSTGGSGTISTSSPLSNGLLIQSTGVNTIANIATSSLNLSTTDIIEGVKLFFTNARAIASTLTGYVSGAGTITSSDTILSAIQKLNGNIAALVTGVSAVSATYPIISSGGATPVISTAFGTTTSNSYAGTQTFTNTPVFSTLVAGTVNSLANGTIYNTATSTPTVSAPITYSGTLGQFIAGLSGAFGCTNASAGVTGCLTGTDWNTFNGKQAAGNYLTALTGDVTASGPGSAAATLATVNSNTGFFTNANLTVNGKGLITAASNGFSYPFPLAATSTIISFTGGLISTASTTINASSTITGSLTLTGATTTAANGLNINAGCFALMGTCLTAGAIGGGSTEAVNWATTVVLSGTPTYINGSSGVGATLTEVGSGALSVDSNNPAASDRVLVKNQANAIQNGIYVVTATGSGIASYVLTRSSDYNTPTEITPGINTYVLSGTVNSGTTWAVSYTPPLSIGVAGNNLNYSESAGTNGTVTSITAATPNASLTLGGTNPITTSGTINFDLNLAHSNTWSVLQTFGNSSTTIASFTYASSTQYFGAGLSSCNGGSNAITWSSGVFGCNTITGGGAYPFTPNTNFGVGVSATSTPIWVTAGLMASSTSYFANASSTQFTSGTIWDTGLTGSGFRCVDANSIGLLIALASDCGTVTSITGGLGLNGGAITTTGTLSLKSYIATSSAETANQIPVWSSTSGTPATLSGGFSGYTLTSSLLTATNASTTNHSNSGNAWVLGNMSVGTTTSLKPLYVFGNTSGGVATFHRLIAANTGNVGTINLLAESTSQMIDGFGTGLNFLGQDQDGVANTLGELFAVRDGSDNVGKLQFYGDTALIATMRTYSGSVFGIGTTTPVGIMDLNNPGTATKPQLVLTDMNSGVDLKHLYASTTAGSLVFGKMNDSLSTLTELARITNAGNFGVGTTSPYWPLTAASSTGPQLALVDGSSVSTGWSFRNAGGILYIATTSPTTFATSTNAAIQIATSTATLVGIATSSPWRTLSVNGTVGFAALTTSGSSQTDNLCLSSTFEVISDTAACVVSAQRFKQNIDPLDTNATLDEVMQLQPVSFNYKPDFNGALQSNPNYSSQQVGFIADAVEKIDPRLVTVETATTSFEGTTYAPGVVQSVRYENMTALLAAAIQAQQNEIASLKPMEKSAENNWQWIAIAILALSIVFQQIQIRKRIW